MSGLRFSIPSKAFILGEYAVLKGAPALVATFAPRFELRSEGGSSAKRFRDLPEAAPVRQLIAANHGEKFLDSAFTDPHRGSGGFGGSTAEFALAYAAIHGVDAPVAKLWSDYCAIQPQASGADLVAQWAGGAVIADPATRTVHPIRADRVFKNLFVFSAAHQSGRKVKTHEHLEALQRADFSQLATGAVLNGGIQAARIGDFETFARSVNEYARLLQAMGFELPRTSEDRAALRDIPGVCAVKGTGAMQADAIVVLGDPDADSAELYRQLVPAAECRDLRLVSSGWSEEPGISK